MSGVFFNPNVTDVMYEAICEPYPRGCNNDQQSFKAYLARCYALTTQLAPWTTDTIMRRLQASAKAAAQSCSGGSDGVTCGMKWWVTGWDGIYGVGEQMSAMEVIQSNLIEGMPAPLTQTEGTSPGDPSKGGAGDSPTAGLVGAINEPPPTTGQQAAASILTAGTCGLGFLLAYYMVT